MGSGLTPITTYAILVGAEMNIDGAFCFLETLAGRNYILCDMGKVPPMCRTYHVPPVRLSNDRQIRRGHFAMQKRCSKCKQYKPLERFSKDKKRRDGLYCQCKDCVSTYAKQHRVLNRDRLLKQQAAYREAHREKLNEYGRQYYATNRARENARGRRYRRNNADRVRQHDRERYYATIDYQRERSKRYRESNPERQRERSKRAYEQHPERWRRYNHVRRTRIKGNGGYYTDLEWEGLKEQYNHTCLCCGQSEPNITLTVDHVVPISMGGSNDISNIQPLCERCNKSKNNRIRDFRTLPVLRQLTLFD